MSGRLASNHTVGLLLLSLATLCKANIEDVCVEDRSILLQTKITNSQAEQADKTAAVFASIPPEAATGATASSANAAALIQVHSIQGGPNEEAALAGATYLRQGECNSADVFMVWAPRLKTCAEACRADPSCKYFDWKIAVGDGYGYCYKEKTQSFSSGQCPEGHENDNYGFYEVNRRSTPTAIKKMILDKIFYPPRSLGSGYCSSEEGQQNGYSLETCSKRCYVDHTCVGFAFRASKTACVIWKGSCGTFTKTSDWDAYAKEVPTRYESDPAWTGRCRGYIRGMYKICEGTFEKCRKMCDALSDCKYISYAKAQKQGMMYKICRGLHQDSSYITYEKMDFSFLMEASGCSNGGLGQCGENNNNKPWEGLAACQRSCGALSTCKFIAWQGSHGTMYKSCKWVASSSTSLYRKNEDPPPSRSMIRGVLALSKDITEWCTSCSGEAARNILLTSNFGSMAALAKNAAHGVASSPVQDFSKNLHDVLKAKAADNLPSPFTLTKEVFKFAGMAPAVFVAAGAFAAFFGMATKEANEKDPYEKAMNEMYDQIMEEVPKMIKLDAIKRTMEANKGEIMDTLKELEWLPDSLRGRGGPQVIGSNNAPTTTTTTTRNGPASISKVNLFFGPNPSSGRVCVIAPNPMKADTCTKFLGGSNLPNDFQTTMSSDGLTVCVGRSGNQGWPQSLSVQCSLNNEGGLSHVIQQNRELSYFLTVQHQIATLSSAVWNLNCKKRNFESQDCKQWEESGSVLLSLIYAQLHLSLLFEIASIEPSMATSVHARIKELATDYAELATHSLVTYKAIRVRSINEFRRTPTHRYPRGSYPYYRRNMKCRCHTYSAGGCKSNKVTDSYTGETVSSAVHTEQTIHWPSNKQCNPTAHERHKRPCVEIETSGSPCESGDFARERSKSEKYMTDLLKSINEMETMVDGLFAIAASPQ